MTLELLFLGTGTSAGIPMIGCDCAVCRSTDPRDQRSRPSVLISYPAPGSDGKDRSLTVTARQTPAPGSNTIPGMSPPKTDSASLKSKIENQKSKISSSPLSPHDTAHVVPTLPGAGVRRLLIDTAPELRMQMLRHRIARIDGVLYTHSHADHVFGLDDLRRFNAVMQQPIDIYGDADTLDVLRRSFRYIFEPQHNINDSFIPTLHPHLLVPGRPLNLFGAQWMPITLLHGKLPLLGFRVDWPGGGGSGQVVKWSSGQAGTATKPPSQIENLKSKIKNSSSLAYCTDISAIPDASLPFLQNLDVLVIDALRYTPHPTHLTVAQALEIVAQLKPRRTFFTHLAHEISHAKLERELPPNVQPAYDGLRVEVSSSA